MKQRCSVCDALLPLPSYFFLYIVCHDCYGELKRIAKGEHSESRLILLFYISIQGHFLKKEKASTPICIALLSVDDLNTIAQWLKNLSRVSLA